MKKRWKITIGIIAGVIVLLAIVWMSPIGRFILQGGLSEMKEQPFDAVQWKAVRNSDRVTMRIRLMMADDLMENKLKTGMDSLTVKEMLGEPERHYGFSYGLGALTDEMEQFYLVLNFDSLGTMRKINITNESKLKNEPGTLKVEVNED